MIQEIRNNQNNIPESYKRDISKVKASGENVPRFLLGDEEEGVVWERSSDKTDRKGRKAADQTPRSGGVTNTTFSKEKPSYTPSREARDIIKNEKPIASVEDVSKESIFSRITKGIRSFFGKVANFFWYGEDKEKDGSEIPEAKIKTETSEEQEVVSLSEEERIKSYIQAGDTGGIMDVLTKGGTIHPARNSTVLTQYDKWGNIVEAKGVNSNRILHTDKHISL